MFRKNTRIGIGVLYALGVISGISTVIGTIADVFGATDGFNNRKNAILPFLASYWKCALITTIILFIVMVLVRWSKKRREKKRLTKSLSWFDAGRRNTKYSDEGDNIYKLKYFLRQRAPGLSWWAVTGVAGIGKTRLVIEVVNDHEFSTSDILWLKNYSDYREEALKKRVDAILESRNLSNIIIAEDAQIYMDNIGMLIGYIVSKPVDEIGDHKLRLLLLIRMGEDKNLKGRYEQLEWGASLPAIEDTRFNEFEDELRLDKYSEKDIDEVVKSFAINTNKNLGKKALTDEEISDLQRKTKKALQKEQMDPDHLRPLFAMFITDAILSGEDPMSWDRSRVLDYAVVIREENFWKDEVKDLHDNQYIYNNIREIICLSIIRGGVKYSELDTTIKELEEQLSHSKIGVKDFLKEMQLLGKDDTIRIYMPDILSEYYVLRILVIEPEINTVNWIISRLCEFLGGAVEFREKVRQDFKYMYGEKEVKLDGFYSAFFEQCSSDIALSLITKVHSSRDLKDSNAVILLDAIDNQLRNNKIPRELIAKMLYDIVGDAQTIEEKWRGMGELKRLSDENIDGSKVDFEYAKGLVHMTYTASETDDKRVCIEELQRLSEKTENSPEIAPIYGCGLFNMINELPEIDEKREYLRNLKQLSEKKDSDMETVEYYSQALSNMVIFETDIDKKNKHLKTLKQLSKENNNNPYIDLSYCSGLVNFTDSDAELREQKNCVKKLESLSKKYKNSLMYLEYFKGLYNITNSQNLTREEYDYYLNELHWLMANKDFAVFANQRNPEIVLELRRTGRI